MTTKAPMPFARILPIEGGFNLRDIGGYATGDGRRVKTGMLYRSGQMAKLSATGAAHMAALGICCIFDLRRHHECAAQPTGWHIGTDVEYWVSEHDVLSGELAGLTSGKTSTAAAMHAAMVALYRELPHQHANGYRQLFDRLSARRVPLLFNCSAGKDRTGVAAALILHVLGVPREVVLADYLLTNAADFSAFGTGELDLGKMPQPARDRLTAADADYLDAMYDELETRFGGIDAYLEQVLGVDAVKREVLRDVLLR